VEGKMVTGVGLCALGWVDIGIGKKGKRAKRYSRITDFFWINFLDLCGRGQLLFSNVFFNKDYSDL
jgi:hypothetical protein